MRISDWSSDVCSSDLRYQPYFITTPSIDLLPDSPHWKLRYDALYREIGTTTPKGFLTRTDYAAWQTELWDADDTVTTSPYYRAHIDDPELPKAEKRALALHAAFEEDRTSVGTGKRVSVSVDLGGRR